MRIIVLSVLFVILLIAPVHAQKESPLIANPYTNRVSGIIAVTPGYEKNYYDAHPEERAMDDAAQANKSLMDMQKKLIEDMRTRQQGYGTGIHKDRPSPSSPPPSGAIDVGTGQFYPGVPGGIINPNTGQFLPDVGRGYIDPSTGRFIPKR
jgi:hypothetical protein